MKVFNQLIKELDIFQQQSNISTSELEFIEYQYNELNNAKLNNNEKQILEKKISLLENSDAIANAISETELLFNDQQGIISYLSLIQKMNCV